MIVLHSCYVMKKSLYGLTLCYNINTKRPEGVKVNDSEELIHVRIGSDLKRRIQELVDRGDYKDITSFVKDAVIERLDPYWDIEKIKKSIIYLKDRDPDFRKIMNLKE